MNNRFSPIKYINSRILIFTIKTKEGILKILSVHAPDISKPNEETGAFYDILQEENKIPKHDKIIILVVLNASIKNKPIPLIMRRFNDDHINPNGEAICVYTSTTSHSIKSCGLVQEEKHQQ